MLFIRCHKTKTDFFIRQQRINRFSDRKTCFLTGRHEDRFFILYASLVANLPQLAEDFIEYVAFYLHDLIFLCIDTLLLSGEDIFLAQPLLYPLLPITPFACKSSVIISIYIAVEKCLHVYGNNVLVLSDLRNGSRGISASNYAWMFASPTLISE